MDNINDKEYERENYTAEEKEENELTGPEYEFGIASGQNTIISGDAVSYTNFAPNEPSDSDIEDNGMLIVGRGGIGKSSTALSALQAGMRFIGDDYLVVGALELGGENLSDASVAAKDGVIAKLVDSSGRREQLITR